MSTTAKLQYKDQYRKKGTGQLVFVYFVIGTAAAIEAYKAQKGDTLRTENEDGSGRPLFFTTRYSGKKAEIIQRSETAEFVVNNDEAGKMKSLVDQYGYELGMAIYRQEGGTASIAQTSPEKEEEEQEEAPEPVGKKVVAKK